MDVALTDGAGGDRRRARSRPHRHRDLAPAPAGVDPAADPRPLHGVHGHARFRRAHRVPHRRAVDRARRHARPASRSSGSHAADRRLRPRGRRRARRPARRSTSGRASCWTSRPSTCRCAPAPAGTVRFDELGDAMKSVELWLPQSAASELRALRVPDGARVEAPEHRQRRWVHYGSSISHCVEAHGPTDVWPAVAARLGDVELLQLAFAGQCQLDQFVARTIGQQSVDLISLKVGINVVNANSLTERTFPSALHGFLDTVREHHPDVPLLVASPIVCPMVETPSRPDGPRRRRRVPRRRRRPARAAGHRPHAAADPHDRGARWSPADASGATRSCTTSTGSSCSVRTTSATCPTACTRTATATCAWASASPRTPSRPEVRSPADRALTCVRTDCGSRPGGGRVMRSRWFVDGARRAR